MQPVSPPNNGVKTGVKMFAFIFTQRRMKTRWGTLCLVSNSSKGSTQHRSITELEEVKGQRQKELEKDGRETERQRYSLPRSSFMSEDQGGGEAREGVKAGREREGM